MTSSAVRYRSELLGVLALYGAALIVPALLPTASWPRWALAIAAVAPALAACLIVPVVLRFVRAMDEFQRRVVTEACLVSLVVVGLSSFAYAFAQPTLGLPVVGLVWVWPALMGTAGAAQILVRRRLA